MDIFSLFRRRPKTPPALTRSLVWEDYQRWVREVPCVNCGITKPENPTLMWATEDQCYPCWYLHGPPAQHSAAYQRFRARLGI